jgi:hypothetical protein
VAVDGGFLDQLVQFCSRGNHALGDLAFGHALFSRKLGDEDQSLKRFFKPGATSSVSKYAPRRAEHDFRHASWSKTEPVRALASARHPVCNLAVS